jgi:hypothetical protein
LLDEDVPERNLPEKGAVKVEPGKAIVARVPDNEGVRWSQPKPRWSSKLFGPFPAAPEGSLEFSGSGENPDFIALTLGYDDPLVWGLDSPPDAGEKERFFPLELPDLKHWVRQHGPSSLPAECWGRAMDDLNASAIGNLETPGTSIVPLRASGKR